MNETETPPVLSPPRRRRKRFILFMATLVAAALGAGAFWLLRGHWELQDAIAEADRLDTGWRWDELEARREVLPDAENSMAVVKAVKLAIPFGWPSPASNDALRKIDPQTRLDSVQLGLLEKELQAARPALGPARSLADHPKGQFVPRPAPVAMMVLCSDVQNARTVANLLRFEAMYRAERGEPREALAACRGGLNAGRAIGDWPAAIGMLVRIACQSVVLNAVERILAQTEPEEADLATLQRLLEDEAAQPLLLHAARGERAMADDLFDAIQSGRLSGPDLTTAFAMRTGPLNIDSYRIELSLRNKGLRAEALRNGNRLVEIAKLPVEAQKSAIERFREENPPHYLKNVPLLRELTEGDNTKWMFAFGRSQARLRTMIALLAAERFRRVHGRWPKTLNELCPAFLQAVPLDPGDGRLIKLRLLADGLVIHAIGADGKDHGGTLNHHNMVAPGTDYGFRLWDPKKRRQPAPPPLVGPLLPAAE